ATSGNFVVNPFGFTFSFPSTVKSTQSFSVVVTALNADDSTATNFDGAADELTLTANGPVGGSMTPSSLAQNPTNGVTTFASVSLDKIGSYTFTVTGTGSGDSGVTATSTDTILVTANHLVFKPGSVPSSVVSGAQFSVAVLAEDVLGNQDPNFNGLVTLGKQSGPGTLSGGLSVTADAGEADFTGLSLDHWGDYTLQATTPGLTPTGPSSTITV